MSADRQQQGGGLSVQTLIVASLASMTAAVVIHEFWAYGAILGAAITPVIVALTSEALKKPIDRAARLRQERRERPAGPRDDRFGIWEADRPLPWYRRLEGRHLRLALVTGLVAFVLGAVALTAAELVAGGSLGSGGKRTTLVGGGDRERDADREDEQPTPDPATTTPAPGTTQPAPETTPAPAEPAPAPRSPRRPSRRPHPIRPSPARPHPAARPHRPPASRPPADRPLASAR
jgi:hypothetical protein